MPPFEETLQIAKQQMISDVLDGSVPVTVDSFAELHRYVDANYYGNAFEHWSELEPQEACAYWNKVQDALDEWIKHGFLAAHAANFSEVDEVHYAPSQN
jgi:hypothetical protein